MLQYNKATSEMVVIVVWAALNGMNRGWSSGKSHSRMLLFTHFNPREQHLANKSLCGSSDDWRLHKKSNALRWCLPIHHVPLRFHVISPSPTRVRTYGSESCMCSSDPVEAVIWEKLGSMVTKNTINFRTKGSRRGVREEIGGEGVARWMNVEN